MWKALLVACIAGLIAPTVAEAAFPGENGKIAFGRFMPANSNYSEVLLADADGTDLVNLTNSPTVDDRYPAWGGDGQKLTFHSFVYVYKMNSDGSDQTLLQQGGTSSFSPDGNLIAFERVSRFLYPNNGEIFVMNADGTNARNLTNDPPQAFDPYDVAPVWSPDGTQIAFMSNRGHYDFFAVYVMNPDGGGMRAVTSGAGNYPDWSPDGSKLVFDRFGDIYTINADGTGEQRITSGPGEDLQAVWSPDGTKIVFMRFREGSGSRYDLYMVNADGTGEHLAIPDGLEPDWQPLPNHPPDCSGLTASTPQFDHADRRLRIVTVSGATDADGDAITHAITGVTQDEPVTGRGDSTRPDARLLSGDAARVRAERAPRGDGRVYRLAVTAKDTHGASCSGYATVSVPRHRNAAAVDSAPPSYDSLGS